MITAERAKELTGQIQDICGRAVDEAARSLVPLIITACKDKAWLAMGYPTWDDYCEAEMPCRRWQLDREVRDSMVRVMREEGMTMRSIGAAIGMDDAAVSRVKPSPSAENSADGRRTDARGRNQPTRRTRPATVRRLRVFIERAYLNGYSCVSISKAVGRSASTVSAHSVAIGLPHRPGYIQPVGLPELEPFDWSEPDASAPPAPNLNRPLYQHSTTVSLLLATLRELRTDNAENRFANDVHDAIAADDEKWLSQARAVVGDMDRYLNRLKGVLESDSERERGRTDWSRRDDVGSHLRAVN
jgi:hypothetical protein